MARGERSQTCPRSDGGRGDHRLRGQTGTLTQNHLRLERLEPVAGATREDVLRAAYAAAEAEIDPVDRALLTAARNEGLPSPGEVVRSIPFEASRKRQRCWSPRNRLLRRQGRSEVVLRL
jgi:cation transport ATPase